MLLALETATDACSVALATEQGLRAALTVARPRVHAAWLVPLVQDALRYADIDRADIAAVAVSAGPGSYTGLRIGVSTAKGLAHALECPLVAVSTLRALAAEAASALGEHEGVAALLGSRRGEVYAGAFGPSSEGLAPLGSPQALAAEAVPDWLRTHEGVVRWRLAGPGAVRLVPHLDDANLDWTTVPDARPTAEQVARLGLRRLAAGQTVDLATFEPLYLKAFVATRPRQTAFEKLPF